MILHVDMDAFYAAVEQRDRPELRGKPVIVGASPTGRGVVSTCSYEARKYGVHSAMPIRDAYRRCPGGVFLPVRMARYAQVSEQVMEILGRFTPAVEPLSIDEAFLDVSGCERLFGPPAEIARQIREAVLAETGLTCSAGVAPNKFLAKLATELGKPDGLTVVPEEGIREFLAPLEVRSVFGVGKRTAQVLGSIGIRTLGEIVAAPEELLRKHVGPASAIHMQRLARGEDSRKVEPLRQAKQLGAERTFGHDLEDPVELRRHLLELCCEVGRGLRKQSLAGQSLRLKMRLEDFTTYSRTRRFDRPAFSDRVFYRESCALLTLEPPTRPVRLIGVAAVGLVAPEDPAQGRLFPPSEEEQRAERAERAADRVRARFGKAAIRPASLVGQDGEVTPPAPARRKRRSDSDV